MDLKTIYNERVRLLNYLTAGAIVGALFGCIEYIIRIKTNDDPQEFIPLIIRSVIGGMVIIGTVFLFELLFKVRFTQRPFLYLVLARSFVYTAIITFWLSIINGVWFVIDGGASFQEEFVNYFKNDVYLINLFSIFLGVILAVGLGQINSLHRKVSCSTLFWESIIGQEKLNLFFALLTLKVQLR
jgi:hypothetical protein